MTFTIDGRNYVPGDYVATRGFTIRKSGYPLALRTSPTTPNAPRAPAPRKRGKRAALIDNILNIVEV